MFGQRKPISKIFINYRRDDTDWVAGRLVDGLRRYFGETLWVVDLSTLPILKRCGIWILRVAAVVGRDFGKDNCMLRASALTFTTFSPLHVGQTFFVSITIIRLPLLCEMRT